VLFLRQLITGNSLARVIEVLLNRQIPRQINSIEWNGLCCQRDRVRLVDMADLVITGHLRHFISGLKKQIQTGVPQTPNSVTFLYVVGQKAGQREPQAETVHERHLTLN